MRTSSVRVVSASVTTAWYVRSWLVIIGIVAALLLFEGTYRAYKLFRYGFVDYLNLYTVGYFEPHPTYGYVLAKNFRSANITREIRNSVYGRAYHMTSKFSTNSLGYRGSEFSPRKEAGTFRIVTFGGSTTMGVEVDDEDTWPAALATRLQREDNFLRRHKAKRIEVINAAVGGWRSLENVLRLREDVRHFGPDVLLLAFSWNDAWKGLQGLDPDAVSRLHKPWWRSVKIFENLSMRYSMYRFSNERHLAGLRAGFRLDAPWVHGLTRHILAMQAIASDIKATVMLVNLPGLARAKETESLEARLIVERTRMTERNIPFFVEFKEFETKLAREIGRQHGIGVVDVHGHFDVFADYKRVEMFTDEMHLTAGGTRETAEAVARALAGGDNGTRG